MRRLTSLVAAAGLSGVLVATLVSPAHAAVYDSRFSNVSTPEYTASGNQQVVLSGRVQPAAAGRTVSLLRVNPDSTTTFVQGTVTDAAGNFQMTSTVTAITTYRFFSAKQIVGADTYRPISWGDFTVRSLRLWDSFDYTGAAQMSPKWALRSNHLDYGTPTREHTKASWDAITFDGTGAAHFGLVADGTGADGQPLFKVPHISAGTLGIVNGHVEARIKFHRPKGAHGALWWQSGYEPGGGEFDVVEFFGERRPDDGAVASQRVQHTLHLPGGGQVFGNTWTGAAVGGDPVFAQNFTGGANGSWWNDYHVFSGYWAANRYVFSIDGQQVGAITNAPVATVPGEILLSLLVNEGQEYEALKARGTTSGYRMSVDWIRVWR